MTDLIKVYNLCPPNISSASQCLNDSSWHHLDASSINASQYSGCSSVLFLPSLTNTVYSSNATILTSTGGPPNFVMATISAHDLIFALNQSLSTGLAGSSFDPSSTAGLIVNNIITFASETQDTNQLGSDADLLLNVLATPFIVLRASYLDHFSGRAFTNTTGLVVELDLTVTKQRYLIFEKWPIIVYCIIATALWLFCTGVLAWTFRTQSPLASPFPLFDVIARFVANSSPENAVAPLLQDLGGGDGMAILSKLQDKRLYLGNVKAPVKAPVTATDSTEEKTGTDVTTEDTLGRIGFSVNAEGVEGLVAGRKYD
jgi:hypothetical protein